MFEEPRRSIRLYELVLDNGCPFSPFVWRIKYAIAHKGFDVEAVPVRPAEVRSILGGQHAELPVIEDNRTVVAESWAIAEHIERAYMDRSLLFRTCGEHVWSRFFDRWMLREVVPYLLSREDRNFLRGSRELRFLDERQLANFFACQPGRADLLHQALEPLRTLLQETPWLGGIRPNYVDFCGLSIFLWAAAVGTLPRFEADSGLVDWLNRGFDLYGGLGRDQRLFSKLMPAQMSPRRPGSVVISAEA